MYVVEFTVCPKGWQKRSRSCYKFEDKKKEQFAGAAKYCEELNSRLLIIDSEKENKLIRKMLKSKYPDIASKLENNPLCRQA